MKRTGGGKRVTEAKQEEGDTGLNDRMTFTQQDKPPRVKDWERKSEEAALGSFALRRSWDSPEGTP